MKSLLAATLLLALSWASAARASLFTRDSSPLFVDSFQIRPLSRDSFDNMLNDTSAVWLVDFYAPWCPHCRDFAPELEKVAAFYADSAVVHIGAVDCTRNKDICNDEKIYGYPSLKLFHVPDTAEFSRKMSIKGRKTTKAVISWIEGQLQEYGMASGISEEEIEKQIALIRSNRVVDKAGGAPVLKEQAPEMKYKRLHDAGTAAMLTLENSFYIGTTVLEGDRYDAALKWVEALAVSFPMEGNRVAFATLLDAMRRNDRWEQKDWNELIQKWKTVAQKTVYPKDLLDASEEDGWSTCTTYTCALWTLFHSMTVSNLQTASPLEPWKPSELAAAMRTYIKFFFGCEECRHHFMKANPDSIITDLAKTDADGPKEVVLWMWRMHNKVNKFLKKGQWPSVQACPICYVEDVQELSLNPAVLHEDDIVAYLTSVFRHEDQSTFSLDYAQNGLGSALWTSVQGFGSTIAGVLVLALLLFAVSSQRHRIVNVKSILQRQHLA